METVLGLVYRTINHGRTPEQNRQHRKKLQYDEEKARVFEQRPSPLPEARRNLSQASLSAHSQPLSPLFAILPLEIRQMIYFHVLGGEILHFTHVSKRVVHQKLCLTEDCRGEEPSGDMPLCMPPYVNWLDERNRIPESGQFDSTSISLLQTCHAVYNEAISVLYSSNTFSMSSPLVLLYLKDYVLRPQYFAKIRHIRLVPWVYFEDPTLFIDKVHEPYDRETWLKFWDLVVEMDLKSLGLWVEYWGTNENHCVIDADWIQPLLKVKGVESMGIQLQFRANAWDERRQRSLEEDIRRVWTTKS